jgi:methylated-DNA-[protein]-cysteine S-methyltransferase
MLSNFEKSVLNLVSKIPKGKVISYKKIAEILGNSKMARAVGNALKRNPYPIKIPCHRVVKSDGSLGGYKLGLKKKKALLLKEGVKLDKNKKIIKMFFIENL